MKKLLNISVIAALAILPLAANADPMTEVTINTPADNQKVATTGYVKGAYNALVTGKQDKLSAAQLQAIQDVTTLNSDVSALKTTVGDSNSGLVKDVDDLQTDVAALQTASGDYATKTAAENMVETARITATVPTLTTWGNDSSNGTVGVTVSSIAATYAEPSGNGGNGGE